jgi:hypothetical protein
MKDWLIKYWLAALFAALTGALGWAVKHVWHKQKAQGAEQEAVKEGMLALLHDRIYQGCTSCLQKERVNVYDIKNLEYLYRPYHALGGNGTGTELYERVKKMPVEPAEQE